MPKCNCSSKYEYPIFKKTFIPLIYVCLHKFKLISSYHMLSIHTSSQWDNHYLFFFQIEDVSQAVGLRVLDVIDFFFSSASDQLCHPRGKTHMQHYGRHGVFSGLHLKY